MLDLKLLRGHQKEDNMITAAAGEPVCRFVNVQLCGGAADLKGTVLLENPQGTSVITLDQLKRQVAMMFDQQESMLKLSVSATCDSVLTAQDLSKLHGCQLYAFVKS
ncbi:isoleucine--tRNA ligase, cytoplasmic-like isoform X2 [Orbicella faveolata]|uniref:isoleucine--tRNA ligase, cytoplasmic-like isoform X2 n=1 Tax=Orbicella faveolata TaxID=48498 RepID=UPI0009E42F96|nr:isoleucine--tRNA ligase, cytoplasmic-like isoform X2 [Orbicella faveolata]